MLYNLIEYLRTELPAEVIYPNFYQLISGQTIVPDRACIVRETSGAITPWFQFARSTFQVITRDQSLTKAREFAYSIYGIINNKFGLILPSVIVNSLLYNSIHTGQISAIQQPYCLGPDEQGRTEYSTNYYVLN